jgi:hypothetical protein
VPETFSGARLLHLLCRVRIAWFLGRALLGALYDISIPLLVVVSVVTLSPSPLSPNSPR